MNCNKLNKTLKSASYASLSSSEGHESVFFNRSKKTLIRYLTDELFEVCLRFAFQISTYTEFDTFFPSALRANR